VTAARKFLVVYYSRTGNTARVARAVATRLKADVEQIGDKTDRHGLLGYLRAAFEARRAIAAEISPPMTDPAEYAVTIIGSPVWAWNIAPAVRAYLQSNRGRLRAMACFVTSGDTDAARVVPEMERVAQLPALALTGLNARELRDAAACEGKLDAFVSALQRAATT